MAAVHYTQLSAKGSCCIADHRNHEGCLSLNPVDASDCKLACDVDDNCKDYVVRYNGMFIGRCFVVTTSICPKGFFKLNSGNVGDIEPKSICISSLYLGCSIKQFIGTNSTSSMSAM